MISEIYVLRQEEIDEDFYFLINNNTGLNMTIPMDLTSFILFHLYEGNTIYDLEIFLMNYLNSKFKTKEHEQFNLNNKTKLSNIIRYSNAIEAALLNKHITKKL